MIKFNGIEFKQRLSEPRFQRTDEYKRPPHVHGN